MAGRVQWEAQVDSNVAKLLSETKELRDQLDGIKKGNYEIKLNIDDKKLEKVISNLDKMLESLGKGTGDFKEFENLSKQLNKIVSEVKELHTAFGGINDSGVSNLLSSIQSIDKSLSSLSEHIISVNKDFGSVGKNASDNVGQINEVKKATEGLTEATKELANARKNVANKSNISSPIKDTFQGDVKASVESSTLDEKEWDKNVKAIQEYMDANTKLNNLKAQDKGTGKKSSEIAYQTKEIERLEKVAIEARAALSSMFNPHEAPIDDWNKWLEAMKQFNQATEGSARSVARLEDTLRNMAKSQSDKIKSVIESNQAHLDKLKPSEGNRSVDFEKIVQEYKEAINALDKFHATLDSSTPLTKEQSAEYEKLASSLQEARVEMEKFSAAEKGSTEGSRWKEIDKITKYLEKNTRISKIAKQQLEDLVNTLKNVSGVNVDNIHLQFNKIAEAERAAGREGKKFWDIITDKAVYGAAAQLAGYYLSLTDFIRYGKQAIDTIIELDTALVDLKKTTSMTSNELNQFYIDANESAKEYGVTTQEIIDQASSWSRLGYSSKEESTMMAELSSKFAAISPEMDAEQAQSGMVSIMKAWGIEVEQAEDEIISKINSLGNNFALSNADLVEGMQRSAAALAATGTTWTDAFALFTGAQEVLQNSEVAGRALRSISMRIHGYSEDSEDGLMELDEELTNITGDLIDLTKTAEHSQGVSIFKEGSTTEFKSLVDYFGEINAIWDEMTQKQQNDFLQKAFGKTQANLCLYVQKCA